LDEWYEWDVEERDRDTELYQFYNVLWVEWVDVVAYRKGVGRVMKEVWEGEEREEIDFVLG